MNNFGLLIRDERKKKTHTIAKLFQNTGIDAALISKIETGDRVATRKQVEQLIIALKINEETAYSYWLKDKILYQLKGEPYGIEALKAAEEEVRYFSKQELEVVNNYSQQITDLLSDADVLKKKWINNKPINNTQLSKITKYFHLSYTYESNRVEGNTLTSQETHLVINKGITISGKSMREHLEAINHREAIDLAVDLVKDNTIINERIIKKIHYTLLKGIDRKNAGVYRSIAVYISGSQHIPPQPYQINRQMEEYIEFYNQYKNKVHPIILAARMHEKLATIHPFTEGNGRTSRLIMNLILLKNGFTIANIKGNLDSRMNYYKALETIQTSGDYNPFIKLVIQCSIESLKSHIELAG